MCGGEGVTSTQPEVADMGWGLEWKTEAHPRWAGMAYQSGEIGYGF